MSNLKTLLALALALLALALPSVADANPSHTISNDHLGTVTVQVEVKGPHELGWTSLGFKPASCDLVALPGLGCLYDLAAVEVPPALDSCPYSMSSHRLSEFPRAYSNRGEGESHFGAHSFRSAGISQGNVLLCWYVSTGGSYATVQNVARTKVIAPS